MQIFVNLKNAQDESADFQTAKGELDSSKRYLVIMRMALAHIYK